MKTNGQLRTKVWWPSKNKDEERKCRNIGNILVISWCQSKLPTKPTRESLAGDHSRSVGALTHRITLTIWSRLSIKMDGSRCAPFYKCYNYQMSWQPFCKVWCVGWFSNLYWVQICVRGEGDVSSENGYHIPPQYTLLWPRANGEVEHENCSLIVVPVTRSRTFRFCWCRTHHSS